MTQPAPTSTAGPIEVRPLSIHIGAEISGLEVDGRWAVSDNLTITGGFAVIDFEFSDFRNGQCYFGQTPDVDLDGDGTPELCDYTGKSNQAVADFQGNSYDLEGKINMRGYTSNPGFAGLVLGFEPGDATNPAASYVLFDWARTSESRRRRCRSSTRTRASRSPTRFQTTRPSAA